MKSLFFTALLIASAIAPAHAQKPKAACPDLAIASYNVAGSIPYNPPLAANEFAVAWEVRNLGRVAYVAADENKQWLSLEVPRGTASIGVHVLPPSGSGPVNIAPGASLRGYIRGTIPAGVPPRAPITLKINYAPASAGGPAAPVDCTLANNTRRVR
jgi:hypothetical protein